MLTTTTRDSYGIASALRHGERFTTHGALSGRPAGSRGFNAWQTGRLPREHHAAFLRADYAVYSYATPIAFRVNGEWHVPDVRYSMTTSHHQGTARFAVHLAETRETARAA